MSTEVVVATLPPCDLNPAHGDAAYDGATRMGPWAYMCEPCFNMHGLGLGTGRGQRLVLQQVTLTVEQQVTKLQGEAAIAGKDVKADFDEGVLEQGAWVELVRCVVESAGPEISAEARVEFLRRNGLR